MEKHKLIVKTGLKVDASTTESERKPKRNIHYQIAEDHKEDEVQEVEKDKQTKSLIKLQGQGVDADGRWLTKGGKTKFDFKRHNVVDENGLIVGVHTTTMSEHDSKGLAPLLEKIPSRYTQEGVWADKGYKVPANDELLGKKRIKNRIMHKAHRNRSLTSW